MDLTDEEMRRILDNTARYAQLINKESPFDGFMMEAMTLNFHDALVRETLRAERDA